MRYAAMPRCGGRQECARRQRQMAATPWAFRAREWHDHSAALAAARARNFYAALVAKEKRRAR